MSASRLKRSIAALQDFDCAGIDADSRVAVALAQVLGNTLEEARAGQMNWSDRDVLMKWLHANGKLVPAPCAGLCRQLEARLSFSFLPGLSWPGREVVSPPRRGRHLRLAADPTDTNKRRNLAGLVPPMDKDMVAMISSTVAASPAALVAEGGGGGGGGGGAGQSLRGGRTALEDGNYSSTDDEGITVAVGSGFTRDGFSPGLGSPEVLPSVLEQGTVDVNSLEEADDDFLLSPTPQGVKNYCVIHRTSSTIRTYFRLFLQEQRPLGEASAAARHATATATTTVGGASSGVNGATGSGGCGGGGITHPGSTLSANGAGVNLGNAFGTAGASSGGGGGGMETLRAFLTSGTGGVGNAGGGGGGAGAAGAGGAGGTGGELAPGRFLLSSKRYRSTRSRSTSFIWSNNGVWKDKQALAKVATQPWSKTASDGILNTPSLLGTHGRSPPANSPTPSHAASSSTASAVGAGASASPPSPRARVAAGSASDDGSEGKARSPALSVSSGGGGNGAGAGAAAATATAAGGMDDALGSASWSIVVRVQVDDEAKLLTATAIVPDPSSTGGGGGGLGGGEQTVEAALADGLRAWDKTGVVPTGMVVLRSKPPKWSDWQGCHTLDFDRGDERVREPSRKNVSMVDVDGSTGPQAKGRARKGSSENICGIGTRGGAGEEADADTMRALQSLLQVGKISEEHFSLDFCWPLSPLQAFVAAMSIFDG